jgi:hypothetical protein
MRGGARLGQLMVGGAQVDAARAELQQQVVHHTTRFAQAEKSIQKRIQKLEKLNFRNQLKSYLSDSSQNTTSTNL